MSRRSQLPVLFAIACALFLRALVPTGWMPASGAGLFAIELCPSAGPVMAHGGHHDGKHDHGQQGHDGDCSFAPLAASVAGFDQAELALPALIERTIAQPAPVAYFPTGPPALLPPATGPPPIA